MGVNVRRLQEVVDKGSELICRDDQAAYAITVGARGHTTRKVGEVTSRTNRGRYRVSYTLLLTLSLSSQSLSATISTINIDLL